MKKSKRLLYAVLASIFIIGTMAMQAFAYHDGDREISYFNFTFGIDESVQISSTSMKRLYNRGWIISVNSVRNNHYGISYVISNNNDPECYNSLVSYSITRSGTGNFGGTYPSSDTIGQYLYLVAMIDVRDVNRGVTISGQWSADSP